MLQTEVEAVRNAALNIDRKQPRTCALRVRGEVEQCPPIEQDGMTHERIVKRDPLETLSRGPDSPDVPIIGRNATHEVDEGIVRRPQRKVTVHPRRRHIDLARARLPHVSHEQRIAWRSRVIHKASAVARISYLGRPGEVALQRSPFHRHSQNIDVVRT